MVVIYLGGLVIDVYCFGGNIINRFGGIFWWCGGDIVIIIVCTYFIIYIFFVSLKGIFIF